MNILNEIRHAHLQVLKEYFVQHPSDLNKENEKGVTPLIAAIASGRVEVVELMLEFGVNPNHTNSKATLPLVFAIDSAVEADDYQGEDASHKYLQIIALLIEFKASPEISDVKEGVNALTYAKTRLPESEILMMKAL